MFTRWFKICTHPLVNIATGGLSFDSTTTRSNIWMYFCQFSWWWKPEFGIHILMAQKESIYKLWGEYFVSLHVRDLILHYYFKVLRCFTFLKIYEKSIGTGNIHWFEKNIDAQQLATCTNIKGFGWLLQQWSNFHSNAMAMVTSPRRCDVDGFWTCLNIAISAICILGQFIALSSKLKISLALWASLLVRVVQWPDNANVGSQSQSQPNTKYTNTQIQNTEYTNTKIPVLYSHLWWSCVLVFISDQDPILDQREPLGAERDSLRVLQNCLFCISFLPTIDIPQYLQCPKVGGQLHICVHYV